MGDRTDNREELVQSQENRLYRAALAACCVLVLGAGQLLSDAPFVRGVFAASPSESGTSSSSAGPAAVPEDGQGAADYHGFLVEGPEAEDTFSFYALPAICYQSVDGRPEVNADLSRYFLEGSFSEDLTKAEVQNIFWGPAGRPEGRRLQPYLVGVWVREGNGGEE